MPIKFGNKVSRRVASLLDSFELTNIEVVDSAGCSYNEYVSYMILEIDKSIKFERIKVKFNRDNFVDKLNKTNFPDKKNIMKYFYGIE